MARVTLAAVTRMGWRLTTLLAMTGLAQLSATAVAVADPESGSEPPTASSPAASPPTSSAPATAPTQVAQQDDSADDLAALKRELEREEARIRALEERQQAAPAAQPTQPAPPAPSGLAPSSLVGHFDTSGFTLASADGANVIHFRGNVSVDGRYFVDDYTPSTADTWLLRRLRPTLEGTLDRIFDFRIMPDFGQGKAILQDGWFDARVERWLTFTAGKFKAPVGLERLQLEQYARFIEPSLTADLLPYRDMGSKVGGSVGGIVSYDVGVFDGTVDAGSTDGNTVPDENSTGKFATEARVYAQPLVKSHLPFASFGFGVAATYVNRNGIDTLSTTSSLLAAYKTIGQQSMTSFRSDTATTFNNATIAHGVERRLVPQFYFPIYNVSLLGEYVSEDQQVLRDLTASTASAATLHNTAWQLQAAWFITGEHEAYDDATPHHSVGQGGAGAWELVARVHSLRFDNDAFTGGANSFINPQSSPRASRAVGMGVNWYLTTNFKMQLDYEISSFEGGAIVGNRPDERVLTSQFALIF